MEDARHARDEIFQSAKDNERKLKAMETEHMTLQEVSKQVTVLFCLGVKQDQWMHNTLHKTILCKLKAMETELVVLKEALK